ncbi:MAG: hypothetical protein AB7T63_00430 [Planctomycetota bacterium]
MPSIPTGPSGCPLGRGLLLVTGLLAALFATAPASGSEKVDTSAMPGPIRGAISKYQSKSRACLDKLVGIIEEGSESSVSEWESQCEAAESQLVELSRTEGITTAAGGWLVDEVAAWSRMASIGRGICYVNELLVRQIVHLQWCRTLTEQERKLVGDRVRDLVRSVLKDTGSEARDVLNTAQRYDKIMDSLDVKGAEDVRDIVAISSEFDDEVQQLLKIEKPAAIAEKYIYLMADSIRRRKTRFLKDNDRLLARMRQDLARLVSAKIDPDGRGIYDQYENRIERAALKNIDEYEEELKLWKVANKTFLGNALEFGKEFVDPAIEAGASLVPHGGVGLSFYRLVKAGGSLVRAVSPFLESVRREAQRMSKDYYAEVVKTLGTVYESLDELKVEKEIELAKLERARAQDATDLDEASKEETDNLQRDRDALQKKLDGLAPGDARRATVEDEIREVEQRLRAEPIALARRHAQYAKKTEAMLRELADKYDKRIAMMEQRIEDTVRVGGEIEKVK